MTSAFVHIWGKLVGAVAWDEQASLASFEYDPVFLRTAYELSPFKMPLGRRNTIFSFPELRSSRNMESNTFKGLPGLLADVLPDKYGNQLIDMWLTQQGRPMGSMNPVEMLCFIGNRGMGALEFEPAQQSNQGKAFKVEIDSLVDISKKMLSKRNEFNTNLEEDENAVKEILSIGTSAGGARPKAVIAYNEKTGDVCSGQTSAPNGYEHWLIKLDGVSDAQVGSNSGFGRVEMAYYLMAKECNINMMPSQLLLENNRAHFMTRRFDREEGNIKHHIQTFCAIKHFDFNEINSFSYEQLFQTMRELKLSYLDFEQMYRRMVFNVIARNCDDHTKNFSFILKQDQKWQLAPAYDICHAYRPDSTWVSQHALSINGKQKNINRNDLLNFAAVVNIKKASSIIGEINETISLWSTFAKKVNVDKNKIELISQTLIDIQKT